MPEAVSDSTPTSLPRKATMFTPSADTTSLVRVCAKCGDSFNTNWWHAKYCSMVCFRGRFSATSGANFHKQVMRGLPDACWPWVGSKLPNGYGRLSWFGRTQYAHRIAFALKEGIRVVDIPKGLHVCHSCDNPACCNPNHLWLGDAAANMRDRDLKGRSGVAKLSSDQVRLIRQMGPAALSVDFGVTYAAVWNALRGKTWKRIGNAQPLPQRTPKAVR
jgi:hypothetical protein